jgi:uncharacterized protein (DUF4213/DUF364 family)
MTVKTDLLALMERVCGRLDLAPVRRVYIPEPRPHAASHTEFGVVELEDGAAGLYYAWLGESQLGMGRRYSENRLAGRHPLELVSYLEADDDASRSLGIAAVNAISQSVFRRAGFTPPPAGDSMGSLALSGNDHLGMVGYFPSLVARLRESRIRTTVIERKTRFIDDNDLISVSLDIDDLRACNKVLCTASTLLNDSMDEVLEHTINAETVVVVGPTAGFLPDPLFRRGVSAVGGTRILDAQAAIEALQQDLGLAETAQRYLIYRADYPGIESLLDKASENTEKSSES